MKPAAFIFHPQALADVEKIMAHYEEVAARIWRMNFTRNCGNLHNKPPPTPEAFNLRSGNFRRVNMARFPYNFIFRLKANHIRILVVRHHARHPKFGLHRK